MLFVIFIQLYIPLKYVEDLYYFSDYDQRNKGVIFISYLTTGTTAHSEVARACYYDVENVSG